MTSKKQRLLNHYTYDPLNRHVNSGRSGDQQTQLFYNNDRVATEIKGDTVYRVFETEGVVLAQHTDTAGTVGTMLIAHDDKCSTLATLNGEQHNAIAYTAAGYSPSDEQRVIGFNGERDDKTTGHYLLGNGYRAFNPVLMRFNSPDSWSPFGEGGINAYAYCGGEPVNRLDPTGHVFGSLKKLFRRNPEALDLGSISSLQRSGTSNTYVQPSVLSTGDDIAQLPAASARAGSSSRVASPPANELDQFHAVLVNPNNSDRISFVTRAQASRHLGGPVIEIEGLWKLNPSPRILDSPLPPGESLRLGNFALQASNQPGATMLAPPVPERPASTLGRIRTRD